MSTEENTKVVKAGETGVLAMPGLNINWDEVRNTYAKNATDTEFIIFCDKAKVFGLDPRKKEIYFVKYGTNPGQSITGYEVYLKRAERTGKLDGWDVKIEEGEAIDAVKSVIKKDVIAVVTIYRTDRQHPFVWRIPYGEFHKDQSTHKTMPTFMFMKVAIAQAFRICFPDELGGMPYTQEESALIQPIPEMEVEDFVANKTLSAPKAAKPSVTTADAPSKGKVVSVQPDVVEPPAGQTDTSTDTTDKPEATPANSEVNYVDETTRNKVLGAFKLFNITKSDIEKTIETIIDLMSEEHRTWLLQQYHKLNKKEISKTEFCAMRFVG